MKALSDKILICCNWLTSRQFLFYDFSQKLLYGQLPFTTQTFYFWQNQSKLLFEVNKFNLETLKSFTYYNNRVGVTLPK